MIKFRTYYLKAFYCGLTYNFLPITLTVKRSTTVNYLSANYFRLTVQLTCLALG